MKISLAPASLRVSAILAVSLMLGFTAGCHHDPNKQKQQYLESGKRYAGQGKLKEATIQFENSLKVDRNFAEAHYELSKVFSKEGMVVPAYGELMRTVDLQPNNIPARIDLGNMLVAGKQTARAAEQANAVLVIDPNNADAYALLSGVAIASGNRADALVKIQKALSIDPDRASFHASLGFLQSGDPATATAGEDQLRKAVSLDNKNTAAHLFLAAILQKKNDVQGAEDQIKAAIAADPKNVMARASLAELYMQQKDNAKAEATLHQAAEDLWDSESGASLLATYYIRTNQIAPGAAAYADLVAKHPKSTPLKISYLRLLILNKELPKAKTIGTELAKNDSTVPQVAMLNGMLLLNEGKTDEAFTTIDKAARANPENLELKVWLGRAARAKGDTTVAQQSFRDAVKLNPRSIEAQSGLAQISIDAHDFSGLEQVANSVIAMDSKFAPAYLWRGMAEANQKAPDKADADFRQAITLDPKNSNGYLELGQLRLLQQKVPEGKTLLEQALTLDPNSARALRFLATALVSEKQSDQAVTRVQAQITKSPQNADMYSLLADLQMSTGDSKDALASAEKAIQLNPADSAAVVTYSRAEIAAGDPAKAVAKWQQWTKDHPNDVRGFTLLGSLQESQGDKAGAMDSYKKALSIQPDQPVAANNLAVLMTNSGQNLDVALSLAQIARRGMPTSPNSADTLAWIYYQKGSYSSARDLLEDAIKQAPNSAVIHYHLGMTYAKLSNSADAKDHLKKAAALAPNSPTATDANKELSLLG
ncbi:MAG: tetratricopeptide repeat protein [Edaphobacter sp.]